MFVHAQFFFDVQQSFNRAQITSHTYSLLRPYLVGGAGYVFSFPVPQNWCIFRTAVPICQDEHAVSPYLFSLCDIPVSGLTKASYKPHRSGVREVLGATCRSLGLANESRTHSRRLVSWSKYRPQSSLIRLQNNCQKIFLVCTVATAGLASH